MEKSPANVPGECLKIQTAFDFMTTAYLAGKELKFQILWILWIREMKASAHSTGFSLLCPLTSLKEGSDSSKMSTAILLLNCSSYIFSLSL